MTESIPRPEHPRPQFKREDWINLNGEWTYTFDFGNSGIDRKLFEKTGFEDAITVPFCPESVLSGVAHHDFIPALWYHRRICIPENWKGKEILLHCGAIEYESDVYLDGKHVGRHYGGSSSFSHILSPFVTPGEEHHLVIRAADDCRSHLQPSGKQSSNYYSRSCYYTRVTGIWQTVWLEAVDPHGLKDLRVLPDIDAQCCNLIPTFHREKTGVTLRVQVLDGGNVVAEAEQKAGNSSVVSLPIKDHRNWSPESPFLYDLKLTVLEDGTPIDRVESYFGMRKIHVQGNTVMLNNQPLYQRLVLDQGYYKKGIWTAPTDADLRKDIELSMAAGFNGARLHQKVFEDRFHYWADRLGYLTWAEAPSWGINANRVDSARHFLSEWKEIVCQLKNHPSIITWTPLNETRDVEDIHQHRRFHLDCYDICHTCDGTRPVNDASGYIHAKTDIWTVHNYTQDPETLQQELSPDKDGKVYRNHPDTEPDYQGQPYLVDEFGGIKWMEFDETEFSNQESWGYGEGPRTKEEFYLRLRGQVGVLLSMPHIQGYCYTQLTDVEQEQNGIYNYDRSTKFSIETLADIFSQLPETFPK